MSVTRANESGASFARQTKQHRMHVSHACERKWCKLCPAKLISFVMYSGFLYTFNYKYTHSQVSVMNVSRTKVVQALSSKSYFVRRVKRVKDSKRKPSTTQRNKRNSKCVEKKEKNKECLKKQPKTLGGRGVTPKPTQKVNQKHKHNPTKQAQ